MRGEALLILLQLLLWSCILGAGVECPFSLDYVCRVPWDQSTYKRAINEDNCCQTLQILLGIGFSQYLKDEFVFEFPTYDAAVFYFRIYQEQLDSLCLSPDLVPKGFKNKTFEFISNIELCASIQTKQDWIHKVGITQLDSAKIFPIHELDSCPSICE